MSGFTGYPVQRNLIAEIEPGRIRIVPEDRDVRLLLAVGFSALFGITIVIALVLPFLPGRDAASTWSTLKEVLSVLLPAETGLLGSILGFYFGSKANTPIVESQAIDKDMPPTENGDVHPEPEK
jgi:hypothetical protein